jgi:hypothetical protein
MPFPEREYYSLEHLTRRWAVTLEEVQHAIATGKLIASAWLQPTYAYKIIESPEGEARRFPPQPIEGYVCVAPESCRILFSRGSVGRRKFPTRNENCYHMIVEHLDKVELCVSDLVILHEDLRQFEKLHNLAAQNPCKIISVHKIKTTASSTVHRPFSQQNDCRVVALNGYRFNFGDIQAAIIRQLLAASNTDNPWVHGKTLLANAGSTSMVMRDAFRHQPNWKELVAADGRGYYRLSPTCSPMQALSDTHASPYQKNMGEQVG